MPFRPRVVKLAEEGFEVLARPLGAEFLGRVLGRQTSRGKELNRVRHVVVVEPMTRSSLQKGGRYQRGSRGWRGLSR